MLIATSSIRIIGTISIAGNINANPETEVAENPKPLNPLIVDATSIIKLIRKSSNKLKFK